MSDDQKDKSGEPPEVSSELKQQNFEQQQRIESLRARLAGLEPQQQLDPHLEESEPIAKRSRMQMNIPPALPQFDKVSFKFLAPPTLAKGIEAGIDLFESRLGGGKLKIDKEGVNFPNTRCRLVSLSAPTETELQTCMALIVSVVANTKECRVPEIAGDVRVTTVLPSKCVSALIGVGGAHVQALQRGTGCRLHIEASALGFGPSGDRVVNVHGSPTVVNSALVRIIGCVSEHKDQFWYPLWAARTSEERAQACAAPPLNQQHESTSSNKGGFGKGFGKGGKGKDDHEPKEPGNPGWLGGLPVPNRGQNHLTPGAANAEYQAMVNHMMVSQMAGMDPMSAMLDPTVNQMMAQIGGLSTTELMGMPSRSTSTERDVNRILNTVLLTHGGQQSDTAA